jgi:hypothetical protein
MPWGGDCTLGLAREVAIMMPLQYFNFYNGKGGIKVRGVTLKINRHFSKYAEQQPKFQKHVKKVEYFMTNTVQ